MQVLTTSHSTKSDNMEINAINKTLKRGNAVNINIFFVAIVNAATGKEYAQEERKNGRRIKRSTLLKSSRLRNKAM